MYNVQPSICGESGSDTLTINSVFIETNFLEVNRLEASRQEL